MKSRQVIVYSRSVSNGKFVSEKIAASHLKMGVSCTPVWPKCQPIGD